jgi:4-hydroxy-3-methylbut-2-en-1-yl diphosphate reductase
MMGSERAVIVVAEGAGFCSGVRRGVEVAEELARRPGGRVVTLGPLLHNSREVARLLAAGIEPITEEQLRPTDRVIIRTHGATGEQRRRIAACAELHDATCPYVRSLQTLAGRMAAAGYRVVLVGDKGHPELEGVLAAAAEGASRAGLIPAVHVAASPEEITQRPGRMSKVAVLAQTTASEVRFVQIAAACLSSFVEVRVFNTLCRATIARQREAAELARSSDAMIVVGGRESSNVRRLVEVCAAVQPRTHLVEVAEELDPRWLRGARRVAVAGGASTPRSTIQDVVTRLAELC